MFLFNWFKIWGPFYKYIQQYFVELAKLFLSVQLLALAITTPDITDYVARSMYIGRECICSLGQSSSSSSWSPVIGPRVLYRPSAEMVSTSGERTRTIIYERYGTQEAHVRFLLSRLYITSASSNIFLFHVADGRCGRQHGNRCLAGSLWTFGQRSIRDPALINRVETRKTRDRNARR